LSFVLGAVVFADQNSSECGQSFVGSMLASRRLDGVCEGVVACRSLVRVVPKFVAESRPADLCLAGESWENVGIDLFSYSCLSQDTLFISTMWV
jgi:hypothetical protein